MEIYLTSRFTFNGVKSYDLPLCGLSLKERAKKSFPSARLYLDEVKGKNAEELLGISLCELSQYPFAVKRLQTGILMEHLRRGVLIEDLENTHIEEGVEIEEGAYIRVGSYIERGVKIGGGSVIGPYAYLRRGSKVGRGCRVGDFTEMKNAVLGDNSKMAHLSYLGDADVGENANIGCGVVFVNYDGEKKQRTVVEEGVFIGSNCNLVAPLYIGKNSYIACGSTVTENLERGDLCIARSRQIVKRGKGFGRYLPKGK